MATDNDKPTSGVGVKTTSVETGAGADAGLTLTMDEAGGQHVSEQSKGGKTTVDLGTKTSAAEGDGEDLNDKVDTGDELAEGDKTEGEDDGSKEETLSELPDFDASKPEVLAVYNKQFTKDDGKGLNLEALSANWWSSIKDGDLDAGKLDAGVYKFLDTQFGLSEADVKTIERGQVAERKAERAALVQRAGGQKPLLDAIEWGKNGGYTPAQRQKFNADINGSDREKAGDAVDLLMVRFEKASKSAVNPKVNATANASGEGGNGAKGGDVFKTRDEWQAAIKEAGKDQVKRQAVSNKFRRSPGAKSW